jgi:hypothetical protein
MSPNSADRVYQRASKDYKRWCDIARMMEPTERTAIANAMQRAADQYRKDAQGFVEAGIERSAAGFIAQAELAEKIVQALEL